MDFLRKHWFDIGGIAGVIFLLFLLFGYTDFSSFHTILWLSFVTLLFHQFEEYRFPGYFPRMLNKTLFKSNLPDRYPLNTRTAFIINVILGWTVYILAILFATHAVWLAIASMMISIGNIVVHVFVFNIKGNTMYNPGMFTALFLFLPMSVYFFYFIQTHGLVTPMDYFIGIPLGLILSYVGILKMINWLKDKNTKFIFAKRS